MQERCYSKMGQERRWKLDSSYCRVLYIFDHLKFTYWMTCNHLLTTLISFDKFILVTLSEEVLV